MSRANIETAWKSLESSQDTQDALRALAELEMWLAPEDDQALERLERLARRNRGALGRALERAGVRFRRRRNEWDVLTRSSLDGGGGGPRISKVLQGMRETLRAPDPYAKLDFLEHLISDETFGAAPVLITQILTEREPDVLNAMARALGILGSSPCIPILKNVSRHEHPTVRAGAVEGLAYQRGREVTRILVERLGDTDRDVRWKALEVLEEVPLEDVLQVLEVIPPGRVVEVQVGGVRFLKNYLRHPATVQLLRRWLGAQDPRLSSEALVALASVGDAAAELKMRELALSTDPRVQQVLSLAKAAFETSRKAGGRIP